MSEKIKPADNEANMQNPNKGSSGTNRQYDQVHGNRSGQVAKQASTNSKASAGKKPAA